MSLSLLKSCCGIQDFRGMKGSPLETLKQYHKDRHGKSKNWSNQEVDTPPHTFVILTGNKQNKVEELHKYILDNDLGESVFSGYSTNIKYSPTGGSKIAVIVWRVDGKKFETWHEKETKTTLTKKVVKIVKPIKPIHVF